MKLYNIHEVQSTEYTMYTIRVTQQLCIYAPEKLTIMRKRTCNYSRVVISKAVSYMLNVS